MSESEDAEYKKKVMVERIKNFKVDEDTKFPRSKTKSKLLQSNSVTYNV